MVCAVGCTAPNPAYLPARDAAAEADGPCLTCQPRVDLAAPDAPVDTTVEGDVIAAEADVPADGGPPEAGMADAAPAPVPVYSFESSAQGWRDQHYDYFGQPAAKVTRSNVRAWEGSYALEIAIVTSGTYHTPEIGVREDFTGRLRPGSVITYHLWFPAGGAIEGVQPYVFYYRAGSNVPVFGGIDPILYAASLNPGGWSTITHRVPADVDARGVFEVGLEWRTVGPQSVTVYLDAVTW